MVGKRHEGEPALLSGLSVLHYLRNNNTVLTMYRKPTDALLFLDALRRSPVRFNERLIIALHTTRLPLFLETNSFAPAKQFHEVFKTLKRTYSSTRSVRDWPDACGGM